MTSKSSDVVVAGLGGSGAMAAVAAAEGRVALSHGQLAERTGLSRRSVQTAVALLRRRQLIEVSRRSATDTSEYRPLSPWRRQRAW